MSDFTELKPVEGWVNYPTWAVSLWINNDQGLDAMADEAIRDAMENFEPPDWATMHDSANRLRRRAGQDALRELITEMIDEQMGGDDGPRDGFGTDLMGFALSLVNWPDVARERIERIEHELEEEEEEEEELGEEEEAN